MKMFIITLCLLSSFHINACVQYDKTTDTYTVDPSGCVDIDDDEFLDDEWDEF